MTSRRDFLKTSALASAGLGLGLHAQAQGLQGKEPLFKISLAEWSLNRSLFAGKIDHLDFAPLARQHGIEAVEYVNQFFMDKAKDKTYLREMKARADGEGVRSVLIMCDREGMLGASAEKERIQTVENHKKWVEAAKFLGCHCIRINGYSSVPWSESRADFEESQKLVADGLRRMCEFADKYGLDVIIENHGGYSSHAGWLAGVVLLSGHQRAGTLPDFGNFRMGKDKNGKPVSYDSYRGVKELMPYARGVSVKPTVWNAKGKQSPLNYEKMMKLVVDAGYHGYCGIEHGEAGREWESIEEVRDRLIAARKALGKDDE
ncbi:MAG: twin-arginine translocation signal domain-containing protein [Bacteroidetes bacterium]|nr:MAG: twin-arginine translocation signal domain-containing protein [Bacteroidota bacterium]